MTTQKMTTIKIVCTSMFTSSHGSSVVVVRRLKVVWVTLKFGDGVTVSKSGCMEAR